MRRERRLGILGAGASGLSLALLADADLAVIEKDDRPGGHAASVSVDGWVFDQGPHIMFSSDRLLIDCMVASLGSNVHRCRRNNKVAVAGALAGYPLENDLGALPLPIRADALISMVRAREARAEGAPEPRDLADWFEAGRSRTAGRSGPPRPSPAEGEGDGGYATASKRSRIW
jgi:protoporphyrinogen oxidase